MPDFGAGLRGYVAFSIARVVMLGFILAERSPDSIKSGLAAS
ncbi:hypothetical protein CGRA01v4_10939 [Colletotrichum graminicola]|nr:hypothetical protein CGRA01v4_10939 [Colletotrichum graminicola]